MLDKISFQVAPHIVFVRQPTIVSTFMLFDYNLSFLFPSCLSKKWMLVCSHFSSLCFLSFFFQKIFFYDWLFLFWQGSRKSCALWLQFVQFSCLLGPRMTSRVFSRVNRASQCRSLAMNKHAYAERKCLRNWRSSYIFSPSILFTKAWYVHCTPKRNQTIR